MKDIWIGVAVFAIIFGGAMVGMLLGKILPDQHVGTESRDAIRIVMAMLATLSAVVLGLLTGSSISSLGEREGELRSAGVQFIMLDRTLAEYGPETAQIRTLAKQLLAERISQIWPEEDGAVSLTALSSGAGIVLVQRDLFALSPQTEQQRWLRNNALQITSTIAESRWTTIEQIGSRFPWAFFVVVVAWLTVMRRVTPPALLTGVPRTCSPHVSGPGEDGDLLFIGSHAAWIVVSSGHTPMPHQIPG